MKLESKWKQFWVKIIVGLIILICIIALIYVIYPQFFIKKNVEQVGKLEGKTEEQYVILENEFDKIFTNNIETTNYDKNMIKLKDESKEIVYTYIEGQKNSPNNYDFDIHIPYINIDTEIVNQYNKEIDEYKKKCAEILKSRNKNIICTIDYSAYIDGDILSIIIRSNIKEGANAQKLTIKTYNYNLKTNEEVSFEEILKQKEVSEEYVQNRINEKISAEQKRTEELESLDINIYKRNIHNDIYKIENISEYYIHDGNIYIIFAYGNDETTVEKDIVIL